MFYFANVYTNLFNNESDTNNTLKNSPLCSRREDWIVISSETDPITTIPSSHSNTQAVAHQNLQISDTSSPSAPLSFAEELQLQSKRLKKTEIQTTNTITVGKALSTNAANYIKLCELARQLFKHPEGLKALADSSGKMPVDSKLRQLIIELNTQLSLVLPRCGDGNLVRLNKDVLVVLKNAPAAKTHRSLIEAALATKK